MRVLQQPCQKIHESYIFLLTPYLSRMKKFAFYLSACAVVLMCGCASIKYPIITGVENLNVTDISKDMQIKFEVNLKNPNNYGITLRSMKMDVLLDDSLISGVGLDSKQRIAANRTATLPLSIKPRVIGFPKLGLLALAQLFKKDDKHFKIQGEIVASKFIFRKKYKFNWPEK